jgi:hypothetical protein
MDLKDFIERKVDEILDPSQSYASQKHSALGLVRQAVRLLL